MDRKNIPTTLLSAVASRAKLLDRVIDVIMFGVLIMVAIQTSSAFIRMVAIASDALLLIGWFVAWHRR